jgi:sterol 3beta-glucosyltransferase
MRWPRVSRHQTEGSVHRRPSSSSSSDTHHDEQPPLSPQFQDPGLARLFSDAASFGRILTPPTDLLEGEFVVGDSQSNHETLNGFSQLVARDLDDNERAASEKLVHLSVSNWASTQPNTLAPIVSADESDESASGDEHDSISPSSAIKETTEPGFDVQLTPGEILELLQQDFGALAPPGEEELLLETDATLFHDVVILVWLFPATHSCNV